MEKAQQQLDFIEQMIATAKGNVASGSIYFLIWGWLVFLAAGVNYFLLKLDIVNHWIAWPILMSLAGILSILASIRKSKKQNVKSKIDDMLRHLWLGFIITLVVVLMGIVPLGPIVVYPMLMALYGFGTFVSGAIINFKPLQFGAVAAWVCSSIAFYVDFKEQLILIAVAMLFSYILPGHLLARKKNHV